MTQSRVQRHPRRLAMLMACLASALLVPAPASWAQEFLPTSVEIIVSCGDGVAEPLSGEVCDPGDSSRGINQDVGTSTCADFTDVLGDPFESGTLGCQGDCLAFSTSSCFTCGNAVKERVEACDASDFGGETCQSFGFSSGALICSAACQVSTANCVAMESEGGVPGSGAGGGSAGGSSGFMPGSDSERVTKVVIYGKSYPNSDVHILVDGRVIGIVRTDAKADFYFETDEVTPGVASFSFWSEDNVGLKSTLLSLTFRVTSGAVTTITGVYIAPTIEIDKKSVRQGEDVKIYGQTVPETTVNVHINSPQEYIETASSSETGNWDLVFNTEPLTEEFHTAKALFQLNVSGNIIKSGFSKSVSFHVGKIGGEAVCPGADLNGDGRVNLVDFSILLFYWNTNNECADQDKSGNVDLVDFSIMMFYWTG
jgi:hypothetical protein